MKEKVRLSIIGEQSGFGQKDSSEVFTIGDYYYKNGKHYLFYTEYTEDKLSIGNRLTIAPEYVELKKTGNGTSLLVFREGHAEKCCYRSPAGPMELVSDTKKISFLKKEDKLKLVLEYSFYMNGTLMSDYHLTVKAEFFKD